MSADWVVALATVFAAVAAGFSAWAAILGPRKVAEEAERIRKRNEARDLKLRIFGQILSDRPTLSRIETVRNLNVIDVVYRDSRTVRDAWADLHRCLVGSDQTRQRELYRALIAAMASDLGLSQLLTTDDLERSYHPRPLWAEENARTIAALQLVGLRDDEARAVMGISRTVTLAGFGLPPDPPLKGR